MDSSSTANRAAGPRAADEGTGEGKGDEMIWVTFAIFMVLLSALFLGGLCACASKSEDEIDRLRGRE